MLKPLIYTKAKRNKFSEHANHSLAPFSRNPVIYRVREVVFEIRFLSTCGNYWSKHPMSRIKFSAQI